MHCRLAIALWLGLLWGLDTGCDSLADYRGDYAGPIIDGNFVRRCFPAGTRATLEFDPDSAAALTDLPEKLNHVTTSDGTFDRTPLLPFTALPHDQLSNFDFPGPTRVRNFVLLARPQSGPLSGRDALVVVSLMETGAIELRILARTAEDAPVCDASGTGNDELVGDGHEYFGVFQLEE